MGHSIRSERENERDKQTNEEAFNVGMGEIHMVGETEALKKSKEVGLLLSILSKERSLGGEKNDMSTAGLKTHLCKTGNRFIEAYKGMDAWVVYRILGIAKGA